jgi:hypothetical protein
VIYSIGVSMITSSDICLVVISALLYKKWHDVKGTYDIEIEIKNEYQRPRGQEQEVVEILQLYYTILSIFFYETAHPACSYHTICSDQRRI